MSFLCCSYLACIHSSVFIVHLGLLWKSFYNVKLLFWIGLGVFGRCRSCTTNCLGQALVSGPGVCAVKELWGPWWKPSADWAPGGKWWEGKMQEGNTPKSQSSQSSSPALPQANPPQCHSLLTQALLARKDESWASWGAWVPWPEPWDPSWQLQVSVALCSLLPLAQVPPAWAQSPWAFSGKGTEEGEAASAWPWANVNPRDALSPFPECSHAPGTLWLSQGVRGSAQLCGYCVTVTASRALTHLQGQAQ